MSLTTYLLGKIISDIGLPALINTVTTITTTSKNIYNILLGIEKSGCMSANRIIELDIGLTVKIVENMLDELETDKINSNTIFLSLESLADIIKNIEIDLNSVHKKLKHNNSLWMLKSFRSYNFENELKKLEQNKKILDRRLEMFFKLLNIRNDLKIPKMTNIPSLNLENTLITNYVHKDGVNRG